MIFGNPEKKLFIKLASLELTAGGYLAPIIYCYLCPICYYAPLIAACVDSKIISSFFIPAALALRESFCKIFPLCKRTYYSTSMFFSAQMNTLMSSTVPSSSMEIEKISSFRLY